MLFGIKTGFTTPAGRCLLASASRNNFEIITVVLGAEQTVVDPRLGSSGRYLDTLSLFNYAFTNYSVRLLAREGSTLQTHNVRRAGVNEDSLKMVLDESVLILMRNSDSIDRFLPTVVPYANLRAPIREGDFVGTAVFTVAGNEYSFDLIAGNDIASSNLVLYLTRCNSYIFCGNVLEK